MELKRAETIAKDLIAYHCGLAIHFQFDKAVRRFGQFSFGKKRITLSKPLTLLNTERKNYKHRLARNRPCVNAGLSRTYKCLERKSFSNRMRRGAVLFFRRGTGTPTVEYVLRGV